MGDKKWYTRRDYETIADMVGEIGRIPFISNIQFENIVNIAATHCRFHSLLSVRGGESNFKGEYFRKECYRRSRRNITYIKANHPVSPREIEALERVADNTNLDY